MRIGPELFTFGLKQHNYYVKVLIPFISIYKDNFYGDFDFNIKVDTNITFSKYEYGYVFNLTLLGFGIDVWIGRNI